MIETIQNGIAEIRADAKRSEAEPIVDVTAGRLASYLQPRLSPDAAIEILGIHRPNIGMSKDTFIVDWTASGIAKQSLVIRRDAPCGPVEGSAIDELTLLKGLRELGVPVPDPKWAESDSAILGAPFIVVGFVEGCVAGDQNSKVVGEDPPRTALLFAQLLAKIHRAELDKLGVGKELRDRSMRDHILELLRRFEDQWRRRRLWPNVTLAAAFEWMRSNIPAANSQPTSVHGDASFRNMMVNHGAVTAMLDWELWHVGDSTEDLTYARSDVVHALPWDDFLAEYYRHGGNEYSPASAAYWELWAGLRNAVLSGSGIHGFASAENVAVEQAWAGTLHHFQFVQLVANRLGTIK